MLLVSTLSESQTFSATCSAGGRSELARAGFSSFSLVMLSNRRGAGYHLNEASGQPWLPVTCVIHIDRMLRGIKVGTSLTGWMYLRSDHVLGLLKRERGRYNLMSAATVWPIGRLKRPPNPFTRQGGHLRRLVVGAFAERRSRSKSQLHPASHRGYSAHRTRHG